MLTPALMQTSLRACMQEPPYMLDVALLLFFVILLPIYVTRLEHRANIVAYVNIAMFGWLALVMAASTALRYPWALQNAKEASPQVAWSSITFVSVVDQVRACGTVQYFESQIWWRGWAQLEHVSGFQMCLLSRMAACGQLVPVHCFPGRSR
eukprot:355797-Chlamydomonas_euryale.AAC.1